MSTYTCPLSASFGASKSGQIGNIGYRVIGADGSTLIDRTTSGITERNDADGNATTGVYSATATFDTSWGRVRVVWDITGLAGVAAEESMSASVALDLTQTIPTSNAAQTLGDAFNAARAQGFGTWGMNGTSLKLYAADGVTVVKEFLLDDALKPMARTAV
jgi:hypothetical protein